jgi:CubicO group peptidase (beta-lactamase class C family)
MTAQIAFGTGAMPNHPIRSRDPRPSKVRRASQEIAFTMRLTLALPLLLASIGLSGEARAAATADEHILHITRSVPVGLWGRLFGSETLAERMQHYRATAVSIAVVNDYKIEWARGFGTLAPGSKTEVTDRTLFQAGSISKVLAALGILRLVDSHALSLDDQVNRRLSTWKLPENDFTRRSPVTVRLLLSHTADTTVHGFPGYDRDGNKPTLVQVLDGAPPANTPAIRVEAVPGSRWQYSGGGYLVLQQLAIDTTHKTFPRFMRDEVLAPAGMNDSTYEQPLPQALRLRAACGVSRSGETVKGCWHVYPEMAAAGLWTTPSDLARLAIAMMRAQGGSPNPLLSAALARQMFTSQGYASEAFMNEGLGIFFEGPRFMHGGDDAGFVAVLVGYSSGKGAVIMCNADGALGLLDDIARAIASEYNWPDSDPLIPGYKGTIARTLNALGLF